MPYGGHKACDVREGNPIRVATFNEIRWPVGRAAVPLITVYGLEDVRLGGACVSVAIAVAGLAPGGQRFVRLAVAAIVEAVHHLWAQRHAERGDAAVEFVEVPDAGPVGVRPRRRHDIEIEVLGFAVVRRPDFDIVKVVQDAAGGY